MLDKQSRAVAKQKKELTELQDKINKAKKRRFQSKFGSSIKTGRAVGKGLLAAGKGIGKVVNELEKEKRRGGGKFVLISTGKRKRRRK